MMIRQFLLFAAAAASVPAVAATPEQALTVYVNQVDSARIKATVEQLVGFGTRHTLSSQTDPKRGIGAALAWSQSQFKALGLEVVTPSEVMTNDRAPNGVRITDVIAIQRGTSRPNDVVIISGHIDSRVSDVMNATADAPGANDDGSGTAAAIEAARVLSKRKFPGTIVYAALMGEEQGLFGGKVLANYAKAQGWNVIANLNNDIIGNSCGSDGMCDDKTVRVFSEGPRWQGHEELAKALRSFGGENDSPSRNLSRFLDTLAERVPAIGLDVRQIWRNDRFGRGGDHTELLNAGFPAVRLTVAVENYNQQHQDLRVEKGITYGDTVAAMDFPYLAKVTRLNVAALAALASAPPPPVVTIEGAVSPDAIVRWGRVGDTGQYVIWRRRTDSANWQQKEIFLTGLSRETEMLSEALASAPPNEIVLAHVIGYRRELKGARVDDWVFGVSSVSEDGFESPVASAVPGGAFKPYAPPPAKP